MRADFGLFADDGEIEVRDAAAARRYALDCETQEFVGRCTLPLRITRRKVRADIAIGQRAENGVDQRMQPNVGVGMADERMIVCNAHATDHDVIAGSEGMHIDAGAGAHVAHGGELHCLAAREIFRIGDFDIAGLAGEDVDFHAGPFCEC